MSYLTTPLPAFFLISVMDSTLETLWTIFILYDFVLFFSQEHMGLSWISVTQASSLLQNKNYLHMYC